jgi:transcriptional regulator with XRE-family HTH domain
MKISNKIKAFVKEAAQSDSYWVNKTKLAFSVALDNRRKKANLSYKDLAAKLETSPAYMTKVFRGDANLTIESMVKLARSTGGQLRLEIVDAAVESAPWGLDAIRSPKKHGHVTGVSGTVIKVDFQAANPVFHGDRRAVAV